LKSQAAVMTESDSSSHDSSRNSHQLHHRSSVVLSDASFESSSSPGAGSGS
jgi:hypothetical protein